MAADESLAARIRDALARTPDVEERTLFGCACFFLDGNAVGTTPGRINNVQPGQHVIEIRQQGMTPFRDTVTVGPGAVASVNRLRDSGRRCFYCTNNSASLQRDFGDRLRAIGLQLDDEDVITSSSAMRRLDSRHDV